MKSESQQEAVLSQKCKRDSYVRTDGEVELPKRRVATARTCKLCSDVTAQGKCSVLHVDTHKHNRSFQKKHSPWKEFSKIFVVPKCKENIIFLKLFLYVCPGASSVPSATFQGS